MAALSHGCKQTIVLNFGSLGRDDKLRTMLQAELGGVEVVLRWGRRKGCAKGSLHLSDLKR